MNSFKHSRVIGIKRRSAVAVLSIAACLALGAGQLRAERTVKVDPYDSVDWKDYGQYKANLHTHTTKSDGRMPVATVIDKYHELGYDILSITDHNLSIWPWTDYGRDPEKLGMLAIRGNELSRHHHCNSLFTGYTTPSRNLEESLKGAIESGGIVMLNHPAMHWPRGHQSPTSEVSIPLDSDLRALTTADFTVATWFRTTDQGRNILLGNYGAGQGGVLNLELHTGNRVRIYLESGPGQVAEINQAAPVNTRDGEWHLLAARRAGSELTLFLDGSKVGQITVAQPFASYELKGAKLYLGRDQRTGGTTLNGDLDQLSFWNSALGDGEIKALAAGKAPQNPAAFEYSFERTNGKTLTAGELFSGRIDDSGDKSGAAVNAIATAGGALTVVDEVPAALRDSRESSRALRFGTSDSVPASAVAYYREIFEKYPGMFGMEVLNGTRPLNEYTLDRALWDALLSELMPERPVWGTATDDMHSLAHLGRDWIVVLTDELDEAKVRAAIENGSFYFSSTRVRPNGSQSKDAPPTIERIKHNPRRGVIEVEASVDGKALPQESYKWVSHGKTVHVGPKFKYGKSKNMPADARYLRAEIYGEGGATYTNPIGFAVAD